MKQPREASSEGTLTLECTINQVGHTPPIPNGTFVKCVHDTSNSFMRTELPEKVHIEVPEEKLTMSEAGVGSVIDHAWHVEPLEMCKAELSPFGSVGWSKPPHLRNVTRHMWYLIAFRKGFFWARWNWIEILLEPPE